jgi:hypothetical protein
MLFAHVTECKLMPTAALNLTLLLLKPNALVMIDLSGTHGHHLLFYSNPFVLDNAISDDGAKELATGLADNRSLKELILSRTISPRTIWCLFVAHYIDCGRKRHSLCWHSGAGRSAQT